MWSGKNGYIVNYKSLAINVYRRSGSMASQLERQSSKLEVMGSTPTVSKNFTFCNSRFLRVPHRFTKLELNI